MNKNDGHLPTPFNQVGSSRTSGESGVRAWTPGPWRYRGPASLGGPYIMSGRERTWVVASCMTKRFWYGHDGPMSFADVEPEATANALLIAAAPELYEALERVLPMVRACKSETFSDIDGNEDTRTAAFNNAVAALAKARGESSPLVREESHRSKEEI